MALFQARAKKDGAASKNQITELQQKLNFSKTLQNITNRINAAKNIKQILVDLRNDILTLFDAGPITIYVADVKKNEIYSIFLAGSELSEIRLPISNRSIAGYVANNKQAVNIVDENDNDPRRARLRLLSIRISISTPAGTRNRESRRRRYSPYPSSMREHSWVLYKS